jgi:hypothetical protein
MRVFQFDVIYMEVGLKMAGLVLEMILGRIDKRMELC